VCQISQWHMWHCTQRQAAPGWGMQRWHCLALGLGFWCTLRIACVAEKNNRCGLVHGNNKQHQLHVREC
jgi:hypothetical protein